MTFYCQITTGPVTVTKTASNSSGGNIMDRDVQVKADPRRELPQVDMLVNDLKEEYPDLLSWAIKHASKEAISEAR